MFLFLNNDNINMFNIFIIAVFNKDLINRIN